MKSDFTVEIFDLLIYIIPGFIILFAAYLLFPKILEEFKSKADNIIIVILIAFFLGVVNHQLSGISYSLFRRTTGFDFVEKICSNYNNIGKVKTIINDSLDIKTESNYDLYLYSKDYILENSEYHSSSIQRIIALYIFCRNSIIPVFLIGISFLIKIRKRITKFSWLIYFFSLTLIELILIFGFANYWQSAILYVFRVITISS